MSQWTVVDIDDIGCGSSDLSGEVVVPEPTLPRDELVDNIVSRSEQRSVDISLSDIYRNIDAIAESGKEMLDVVYPEDWRIDGRYLTRDPHDRDPYADRLAEVVDIDYHDDDIGYVLWDAVTDTHAANTIYDHRQLPDSWAIVHKVE